MEGIGNGAVVIDHLVIGLGLAGDQLGQVGALSALHGLAAVGPFHQALEHMLGHDGAVHGGIQRGVDGLRLGSDADAHVEAGAGGGSIPRSSGVAGSRGGGVTAAAAAASSPRDITPARDRARSFLPFISLPPEIFCIICVPHAGPDTNRHYVPKSGT